MGTRARPGSARALNSRRQFQACSGFTDVSAALFLAWSQASHKPHTSCRAETPNDKITNPRGRRALTHWSVVDKVQVPKGLPEGDYVIGFRIGKCSRPFASSNGSLKRSCCTDGEQTPQVWQQCGDVRITAE